MVYSHEHIVVMGYIKIVLTFFTFSLFINLIIKNKVDRVYNIVMSLLVIILYLYIWGVVIYETEKLEGTFNIIKIIKHIF